MMANLGSAIEERWETIVKNADVPGFMKLLFEIARHDSLAVSISVMTTWVRIMRKDTLSESEAVLPLIPGLLDLCTARLIHVRFSGFEESLPLFHSIPLDANCGHSTNLYLRTPIPHYYFSQKILILFPRDMPSWEITDDFAPAL